jgi:O-antigen/teichoic acid export membrane protein
VTIESKQLRAALGHNTSWVLTANAVSGLLNLGVLIWFARVLGSEVMGAYAQVVVAVDLIAGLLGFGFNQALIRTPEDADLRAAVVAATAVQAAAIAAIVLCALTVFWASGEWESTVVASAVVLLIARLVGLFTFVADADYRARLLYRPIAVAQALAAVVATAVGVLALYAGAGVLSMAIRDVTSSLLVFGFFLLRYEHSWRFSSSQRAYSVLWHFTKSLWTLNVLERLALRLDYLLVGYALGRESLGVYYAVRGLVEGALGFALNPVQTVLYSFYCRLTEVRVFVAKLNKYTIPLLALALGLIVLAYFRPPTFGVLMVLGDDYVEGAYMLPGLLMYATALLWFENSKVVAMAAGVHGQMVLARLWQVGVLLVITLPMARLWHLLGATLATGVGAFVLATLASVTLARVLSGQPVEARGA